MLCSQEFLDFFNHILDLNLHMVLNDPPIEMQLVKWQDRKGEFLEKYTFEMFTKQKYYCIDGFPTEGMPGVVVLPPPLRAGYVY